MDFKSLAHNYELLFLLSIARCITVQQPPNNNLFQRTFSCKGKNKMKKRNPLKNRILSDLKNLYGEILLKVPF